MLFLDTSKNKDVSEIKIQVYEADINCRNNFAE